MPRIGRPLAVTSLLIQEAQHRLLAATFSRGVLGVGPSLAVSGTPRRVEVIAAAALSLEIVGRDPSHGEGLAHHRRVDVRLDGFIERFVCLVIFVGAMTARGWRQQAFIDDP